MYRGEALQDFRGPDCRFVNFKKGDPVYVYYKLAEVSPECWAGSDSCHSGWQHSSCLPEEPCFQHLTRKDLCRLMIPGSGEPLSSWSPFIWTLPLGSPRTVPSVLRSWFFPLPAPPLGILHLLTAVRPVASSDDTFYVRWAESACVELFTTLPDDTQPGPDFYGLPWKPVVFTVLFGFVSFVIFFWKTILVKDRVYQVNEQQISQKVNNFTKENELKQKLSNYKQKMKKQVKEIMKQNMILSDEATKYKDKMKLLEKDKELLDERVKSLHVMLESEREQKAKNQDLIMENKKLIEKLKEVISVNTSELSELQIVLNEAKLREEKVKLECCRLQKENTMLKKKKEQLQQEVKDWSTSHAELSEQIKSFEKSQKDLQVALSHKEDTINASTNCITQLNWLQCESESEDQNREEESDELTNGEVAGDLNKKIKDQIKQMMDVSRTQTTISVVEEDLKLLQLKLRASMSTNCNLEDKIKKLESNCSSLQSSKVGLEEKCKTLRQKVEILNELYKQNEMALQKKLNQEEYERLEKEQRLSAADEKVVSPVEEVKNYKRRIEEMEEKLQKTERSFKNQLAMQEKKAHDNWLKARSAERAVAEEKREAANLRQKLLEMAQKMAMRQEEPVIVKPMPRRPNLQNPPLRGPLSPNGSFGPSPVSGGECSPPLTAEPAGRPPSATLNRRDMPINGFDPGCGPAHMNSSSRSSSPAKVTDEGKVNMAMKGPPPFSGVPFMGPPDGTPYETASTTSHLVWTATSFRWAFWASANSSTIWSWYVSTNRL
ncbi:transport and Golgi organization protein 1 homolog [Marmota flaviventris]|uniref:transport and Golgi organization protein 1 homolog n=1 Tax=Marmota flaviventris TaxID=93162 RepID=UPI003A8A28D9